MKEPNINQQKAILHVRGPALIIAGPGSGKTATIVERINSLICNEHINPDHILVVTFSKAAANEMKKRFLTTSENDEVHFGTFHSVAYYILREEFGFNSNSLISDTEKSIILNNILKRNKLDKLCSYDCITYILNIISKNKNSFDNKNINKLMVYDENINYELINKIIDTYNKEIRNNNKLDFDDMIILCLELLKKNVNILNKYRNKFQYIMVDEFQDINVSQYELIKTIAYPFNNIMAVGDV